MSLPIYQRVAVTDAGDVIPGAEYTVINENTGVAAPIYSDRTGATLLTAPYFANSVGVIQFYIAQGTTFRVAASGGVGTYTDRYVYGVAEAVLVQADGNVGIGVVPETWFPSLNTTALQIGDTTSIWSLTNGAGDLRTSLDSNLYIDASGNDKYLNTGPGTRYQQIAGEHRWSSAASGTADSTATVSDHMRITSTGDLVAGGTAAINSSHTFYQTSDSSLNAAVFVNSGPTQPYGIQIRYTGGNPNSITNNFFEAYAWNGSTFVQYCTIRSNGGIANVQANDVNLSDEREKKNITDPGSTWSCLKEWDVIQYHYNSDADDSDKKYGVIAQQVEAHCPEVISDFKTQERIDEVLWVDDDDLPEGVSVGDVKTAAQDEVVRKGVREQQMMWMAIKALQEAQTRIESLEGVAQSLAARIEALEGK